MSEEELEESPCDVEGVKRILKEHGKVLVLVTSQDCALCDYMKGIVEKVEEEHGDKFGTLEIPVDETCRNIIEDLDVHSSPTAILFNSGEEKGRMIPSADAEQDYKKLKELVEK
jgi:thioredoxin-like negative regulator of GroEL